MLMRIMALTAPEMRCGMHGAVASVKLHFFIHSYKANLTAIKNIGTFVPHVRNNY